MNSQNLLFVVTGLLTGLIAGLFYSYTCSVNLGLGKLADKEYLTAMQSINREILNPVFFATFIGTLLALPACTALVYFKEGINITFWLMLIATLLYATGTFGITVFGNVPINEALASFTIDGATASELAAKRSAFEQPWNRLNTIRTITSVFSFATYLTAIIIRFR